MNQSTFSHRQTALGGAESTTLDEVIADATRALAQYDRIWAKVTNNAFPIHGVAAALRALLEAATAAPSDTAVPMTTGGIDAVITDMKNDVAKMTGQAGMNETVERWKRAIAVLEAATTDNSPKCPRDSTPLIWHDGWGYQCPRSFTFVCIPRRHLPARSTSTENGEINA